MGCSDSTSTCWYPRMGPTSDSDLLTRLARMSMRTFMVMCPYVLQMHSVKITAQVRTTTTSIILSSSFVTKTHSMNAMLVLVYQKNLVLLHTHTYCVIGCVVARLMGSRNLYPYVQRGVEKKYVRMSGWVIDLSLFILVFHSKVVKRKWTQCYTFWF